MNLDDEKLNKITEISKRRTIINALANYGHYGISMLVNMFLQAFIIRSVGSNEYAVWPLIYTVQNFVMLIPVGIGAGSSRFIAFALGKKDKEKLEKITSSMFVMQSGAAVLYAAITIVMSLTFEMIFDIPEGAEGIGPWAMFLVGIGGAINIPFGVFVGGLQAAQQFVLINIIKSITVILRLILIVILFTSFSPSLIIVAFISMLLNLFDAIILYVLVRIKIPWLRVRLSSFCWETFKEVNSLSLMILIKNAAGVIIIQGEYIIINKLLEPTLLTGYSVTRSIIAVIMQFVAMGVTVLPPIYTILFSQKNYERIVRILFRTNAILLSLVAPIALVFVVNGADLLELYIGVEYRDFAVVFDIFAIAIIAGTVQNSTTGIPQAFNKMKLVAFAVVIEAMIQISLQLYFITRLEFGVIGIALGTVIAYILYALIFAPIYNCFLLKVSLSKYYYNALIKPLLNCLPFFTVYMVLNSFDFGGILFKLIFIIFSAYLIELIYMFFWGAYEEDRNFMKKYLLKYFT